MRTHHASVDLGDELRTLSAATLRKVKTTARIWDYFCAVHMDNFDGVPGISEIAAFFFYRTATTTLPGDPFAGKTSANTFMNGEIFCLCKLLRARHPEEFTLTIKQIHSSPMMKNAVHEMRVRFGEKTRSIHARPIWFSDEERLLYATSACTMGLQDRAFIRVMTRSGGRASDIAQITFHEIQENFDAVDGCPQIILRVPNIKNQRGEDHECYIKGEAYDDLKAWIVRRRVIYIGLPWLFVTQKGTPITAESVSMWLATLSECAGYAPRFFSSHSGRMAYASRAAAKILAEGGTVNDVYARMGNTGHWAPRSSSIERYCDVSTSRFFFDREPPLTWDQFKQLEPEVLHQLEHINPIRRRPPSEFLQDQDYLLGIARSLGKEFPRETRQYEIRKWLARKLYSRDPSFREWIQNELYPGTDIDKDHALKPLNLLLEYGVVPIDGNFEFRSLSEDVKRLLAHDAAPYCEATERANRPFPVVRARRVRKITLRDQRHLEEVRRLLSLRRADRQVTVGVLPGIPHRILLNATYYDRNTLDVRRLIGPNRHHDPEYDVHAMIDRVPQTDDHIRIGTDIANLYEPLEYVDDEDVAPPEMEPRDNVLFEGGVVEELAPEDWVGLDDVEDVEVVELDVHEPEVTEEVPPTPRSIRPIAELIEELTTPPAKRFASTPSTAATMGFTPSNSSSSSTRKRRK